MATQAICGSCGKTFEPRQPNHKRCDDCFRQSSGPGGTAKPSSGKPSFPTSYFGGAGDKAYLLPAFVSKEVDALARHLASRKLTTGQARRFFNHCRKIEHRLNNNESWEQVSASFESLRAHAQNADSARKIPREFKEFIDDNVDRVTSANDQKKAFMEGFLPHFEALIGYGSKYMKDR